MADSTKTYTSGAKTYTASEAGISAENKVDSKTSRNVYMKDGVTYLESPSTATVGGGGGDDDTTDYDSWEHYSQVGGGGGSSSSSTTRTYDSDETTANEIKAQKEAIEADKEAIESSVQAINDVEAAEVGRVDNIDTTEEEAILNQLKASQEQQAIAAADYATNTGITELQRTEQDAQADYQTQRNQIDIDEQRALDNQVLYNRSRGDNGGIGAEQYSSIQNTAAVNRLTVNKEQTKLATDTQRQIADLRAQGEFDKADTLLSITQNYLSQLMSLKQWADETNVSIDEFNVQVAEWEENYKLSLAQAQLSANTTLYDMNNTEYTNYMTKLASAGQALIQAGMTPTAEQLQAMAWTESQATAYLNKYYP